jgi:hypothetical protein
VIGDCDYIQIGSAFDVRHNIAYGLVAIAESAVYMQVCFAQA